MSEIDYNADIAERINSLPVSLRVSDIAEFLGIALSTAYKLVKTPGFPVVDIPNIRRFVIPKEHFLNWYYREKH
jgi:hypothetical protein